MARRKQSRVEGSIPITSKLPWWVSVALAIAAHLWLRDMAVSEAVATSQAGRMAAVGQYGLPLVFLLLAALSVYGRRKCNAPHEQAAAGPQSGALKGMSGQHFKAVVGEAFRRRGYSVIKAAGGGVDVDLDLVLKKAGETFLVHCKQWRAIKVGVNTVRELHGLMADKGATGGFVLTSGEFTDEARAFARGKNIELVDGKALRTLIRGVSLPARLFRDTLSIMTIGAPFCPECQSRMIKRKARNGPHAGHAFWRCSRYPDCKGTRRL